MGVPNLYNSYMLDGHSKKSLLEFLSIVYQMVTVANTTFFKSITSFFVILFGCLEKNSYLCSIIQRKRRSVLIHDAYWDCTRIKRLGRSLNINNNDSDMILDMIHPVTHAVLGVGNKDKSLAAVMQLGTKTHTLIIG